MADGRREALIREAGNGWVVEIANVPVVAPAYAPVPNPTLVASTFDEAARLARAALKVKE